MKQSMLILLVNLLFVSVSRSEDEPAPAPAPAASATDFKAQCEAIGKNEDPKLSNPLPGNICSGIKTEAEFNFIKSIGEQCRDAKTDQACARLGYGANVNPEYLAKLLELEKASKSVYSSKVASTDKSGVTFIKGNEGCKSTEDLAKPECRIQMHAERFCYNSGLATCSKVAMIYGLAALQDKPEEGLNNIRQIPLVERQIKCSADQEGTMDGKCGRAVPMADVKASPWNGDFCKFADANFYGMGNDSYCKSTAVANAIVGALSECSKNGVAAEQCRIDPDTLKGNMSETKNLFEVDKEGNIYLQSDAASNALADVVCGRSAAVQGEPAKCDDRTDQMIALLRNASQSSASERLIMEERNRLLFKNMAMLDDETLKKYCAEAGRAGYQMPSNDAKCQQAYFEAYRQAKGNQSPKDCDATKGEGSNELDVSKLASCITSESAALSEENSSLTSSINAQARFKAAVEVVLLEARNNPDVLEKARVVGANGISGAEGVANIATSKLGSNPKAEEYGKDASGQPFASNDAVGGPAPVSASEAQVLAARVPVMPSADEIRDVEESQDQRLNTILNGFGQTSGTARRTATAANPRNENVAFFADELSVYSGPDGRPLYNPANRSYSCAKSPDDSPMIDQFPRISPCAID